MTSTWDDEKVARLVKSGGVEGMAAYGVWWRVLEIVACQMDGKSEICSVTYDVTRWSLLLSLRGSHVRHWLEKLVVSGLVTAEWVDSEITVTIPKLLKYRDEYSKKSGQTPSVNTEGEQIQKERKNNNPSAPMAQAKRKTQLAFDLCPDEWIEYSEKKLGWSRERSLSTFETMKLWARSKGAVYLDWEAAWQGWCRRENQKPQTHNGNLFPIAKSKTEAILEELRRPE